MEENDKEFDKLSSSSEEKETETFNKVDERLIEYKKRVDEVNNNEEIRELLRQEDEERKLINTYIAIIDEKVLEVERLKREILYKEREIARKLKHNNVDEDIIFLCTNLCLKDIKQLQ